MLTLTCPSGASALAMHSSSTARRRRSATMRAPARLALLIGAAREKIAAELEGAVPVEQAGTIERAVEMAAERAKPGDVVLLAPACASFDQFENYEHRGRVFKELVAALAARPASTETPRGAAAEIPCEKGANDAS